MGYYADKGMNCGSCEYFKNARDWKSKGGYCAKLDKPKASYLGCRGYKKFQVCEKNADPVGCSCGVVVSEKVKSYSLKAYGEVLCWDCQQAKKNGGAKNEI